MADEIELKLELASDGVDAVRASGILAGRAKRAEQRSIYFDTPDRALAKAGLSLRIRHSKGKRVQTVKAFGAAATGLFARPEWECEVTDDAPVLDDMVPIRAMIGDAADAIAPVFEVRIERRTWIVAEDGATIELAIDRGEAVAGDRTSPVCEIELELKEGDPEALFTLARRIDAVAPARLGVLSKAERGYRLTEPAPAAFKAEPVALTADMTAEAAFQQIVRACLRQFRLNETLLLRSRQAEPLHQARVALRRLRTAFLVFRSVAGGREADRLRGQLRRLAAEFGEARDLDVLLGRAEPGTLHDRLAAAREASYDRLEATLGSQRVRRLMLDLAQWTAIGDWLGRTDTQGDRHGPARELAIAALDRLRRKARKHGRDLADADDRAHHRLRKDAKKLRYAVEFFAALFAHKRERRRYGRFIDALEDLQDQLGVLIDIATAPRVLEGLGLAADPHAASLLARGKKKKAVLDKAEDAYEELLDAKRFWR